MGFYKIENLWLCKLAAVSRQKDDQRMILYEDESKTFLLLWKEEKEARELWILKNIVKEKDLNTVILAVRNSIMERKKQYLDQMIWIRFSLFPE